MEATTETLTLIYELESEAVTGIARRERSPMRVIVLPPAVVAARASRPVHASAYRTETDDDDLANATSEDAAWQ